MSEKETNSPKDDRKMNLYYADEPLEIKIQKVQSAIDHVLCTLKNEMETWERKEYYSVLCGYRNELSDLLKWVR